MNNILNQKKKKREKKKRKVIEKVLWSTISFEVTV